jgi:PAS domain S-box-containing protein
VTKQEDGDTAGSADAPLQVLVVDDDRDDYILTRGVLSKMRGGRAQIEWASSYEAAIEALARNGHDVCLVDYRLGERSGVDLVREAVRRGDHAPLILLTGQGDHEVDLEAMRAGAADFLLKSDLSPSLLERSIRYAIERRRAEDELERSLSLLRATLESTADGILVIDVQGRIAGYNQKFAEMWRVPPSLLDESDDEQVIGFVQGQLADPDAFLAKVRHLYGDPQAASFDILHFHDGRVFERCSQPQIIGGQSMGRVWSFRDVSERERGAEALRHSEALKAAILETALDCIITMDGAGRVVEWNPAAEKTFGYAREQVLGRPISELIVPPALRERHSVGLQRYLATSQSKRVEMAAMHATGREITVELSVVPIPVEGDGGPLFTAYLRDITQRKLADEALRQSEERYRALVEHSSEAMWRIEMVEHCPVELPADEQIEWMYRHALLAECNDVMAQMYGFKRAADLIGTPMHALLPRDNPANTEYLRAFVASGYRLSDVESHEHDRQGNPKVFSNSLVGIIQDGRLVCVWGTRRDVTERKLAEEELAMRARYEKGLAACSQALLTVADPRHAINKALRHLLRASDVSRVYTFENFWDARDGLCMRQTHEACAPGVPSEIDNPELQHLPYRGGFERWRVELAAGRSVSGLTETFSPDERAILEAQGIQSILVLPIWASGRWQGFIGFDDVHQKRPWNEASIQLLRAAASSIGAYLERRQVEDAVRRRAAFEALIASLSTAFIDLPSGRIDEGIEHALRAIGEFSRVDRSYVFLWSDDGQNMSNTHEWCAEGIEPQIDRLQDLPSSAVPWLAERLRRFEAVGVSRVRDLPGEASAEREEFEAEGIQSIVLVPMVYRGKLMGHLGFDSVRAEKAWSDEDMGLLKIAGEMFVNALERKQAEESLRHSEARNRALLNAIPDSITRVRRDGTFLDIVAAQGFAPALPAESMIGRNMREIFAPEIADKALGCVQRALASHGVESMEYQLAQDGETAFFEARMVASGEDEVTSIVRDVSARKRAEAEILRLNEGLEQRVHERTLELAHANAQLKQERSRLADTLSNVPGIVFETWYEPDAEAGRINFISDHLTTMLGYTTDEWDTAPDFWLSKVHPDDREQFRENMATAFVGKDTDESTYRIVAKDGRVLWSEAQVRVVRDAAGAPIGVRGVTMDITQRKRAEAELEAARDEADRANRAKSEFLSRMSHELRTPLNAVLGFGQILERGTLSRSQREGVDYILKAGRHLLDLINEVLDIARIEAGRISLSPEPVPIRMAIREVLDLARPLADGRGIQLRCEVPEHDDRHILADQQRLKQILLNLVSNAVKYNRDGGSVTVRISDGQTAPDHLRLQVSDTGPGIQEADVGRLFTPFERLGAERTRVEGTGIGLALCKRLVEVMGGQIGVQSTWGQGSTFWIELPEAENPLLTSASQIESAQRQSFGQPEAAGQWKSVLYIDDNLSNLRVIEMLLAERPEIKLLTAMQGSTGLDLAREHRPDLILLDLHLPDINGDEVLRRLREEPATHPIPVVMISADATPGEVERLLQAGARDYLTKPLDVSHFLRVLEETLQESEPLCKPTS